jgi:hypothetical protein
MMGSWDLYSALKAEGYILPDECADVTLEMPVDGVMQLVLRVNLTEVTQAQVGRALVRMAEEDK